MQKSYSKNYLNIYFFQILSIVLGFISLLVVVPYLSNDQNVYGIYSICLSTTIFLSYADFGFLGAGMKYAAESYSKGDREHEIELVGFTHFILLIFVLLISFVFLFFSYNPDALIIGIKPGEQSQIAHKLLLILALFSPVIVLQRALQMIFGVRLQDYILQRINIVGNLIKITSVYYFFGLREYDIVNYFLFVQIVNFVCAIIGLVQAKIKYNYDFPMLFKCFRFNSVIFNKTKALAFSSLFVTVSWVIYYELDSFAIGRLLGAKEVAIYAIGFTILSFFRSLLGVFFSPFSARFNHFIGEERRHELTDFYKHILTLSLPIVVFPIVAVVIFARPIVVSWVGIGYERSIDIVQWLVLCNILAFISYPAGMLVVALERLKDMYIVSAIMPIIYWVGIILTIGMLGIEAFALFKFIAFALSGIIYLWISLKFLDFSLMKFVQKNIIPYFPALIIMSIGLFLLNDCFVDGKNKLYLFYNALLILAGLGLAMALNVLLVPSLRKYVVNTMKIYKFFK